MPQIDMIVEPIFNKIVLTISNINYFILVNFLLNWYFIQCQNVFKQSILKLDKKEKKGKHNIILDIIFRKPNYIISNTRSKVEMNPTGARMIISEK